MEEKMICGQCSLSFVTRTEYLSHVCPVTGVTPASPETMGENYLDLQVSALTRGLSIAEENQDIDAALATQGEIERLQKDQT